MNYEVTMKAARKMYRLAKKQLVNPPSLRTLARREYHESVHASPKLARILGQGKGK